MIDTAGSVRQALDRPMPYADVVTARLAAARVAGLSAELRGMQQTLSGALGHQVGWAGAAELAFRDSVSAELNRLAADIGRFEGYAAALSDYARELDVLGPPLLAARARLAHDPASGVAGGVAEFERCWQGWDTARRRCMARLAGVAGAHRHGWSGLASRISGALRRETTGLAGLSHALSDLGQVLMVAGLVLALVCPPAAAVVWAALAVVAVCQLAVDLTRRERGEHVGLAGLGWDALAALPGGRWAAEFHTAAEASSAIERLAPELRSSRLVPGGGLKAHEGSLTHRGHTLLKHYNKTTKQLTSRFKDEPWLKFSSSFTDRQVAEAAISKLLEKHQATVASWLADSATFLILDSDLGWQVGISVSREGAVIATSKLRVTLRKEGTMLGYYIKTAFPAP